jgi:hypothetical protein
MSGLFSEAPGNNTNWLDYLTKIAQILGILAVGISAIGLWINARDLNYKETQKRIEEWQRTVIYKVIQDNPGIKFENLRDKYVVEAKRAGDDVIASDKLQDSQLMLALLNLISNDVIEVSRDNGYNMVKAGILAREYEEGSMKAMSESMKTIDESMEKSLVMMNGMFRQFQRDLIAKQEASLRRLWQASRKAPSHILIALDIIRENNTKLDAAQLKEKLRNHPRVDSEFLEESFDDIILRMQENRVIEYIDEGKIALAK